MKTLNVSSTHSPTTEHPATEHPATEPIAAHGVKAALVQGPIGSVFVKSGHKKESFAAMTENLTGELVFPSTPTCSLLKQTQD
jgi:hypothetical protein